MNFCDLQTERKNNKRKCAYLGMVGDMNLGSSEWRPSMLTITPCHIVFQIKNLTLGVNKAKADLSQVTFGLKKNMLVQI